MDFRDKMEIFFSLYIALYFLVFETYESIAYLKFLTYAILNFYFQIIIDSQHLQK